MYEIPYVGQVTGVLAVDIDQDDFMELFLSFYYVNAVKVYSFMKLNEEFPAVTPDTVETSKCSTFINFPHVTLVFTFLVDYVTSSHTFERWFLNSII